MLQLECDRIAPVRAMATVLCLLDKVPAIIFASRVLRD